MVRAAEHAVRTNRLAELGIPALLHDAVRATLRDDAPSVYGRFDLAYDGTGPAKLLEYNADTPTALLEAGVVQWYWLEDRFPDRDQWNSVHECLVAAWQAVAPRLPAGPLHLAHTADDPRGEDGMTVTYLRETAEQAGISTVALTMQDLGWEEVGHRFVDLEGRPVRSIFALYPWEWMAEEPFGIHAVETSTAFDPVTWIEPAWKVLLSSKALLAVAWELEPGHPNLLPTYLDGPRDLRSWARKPRFGREGADVTFGGATAGPGPADTGLSRDRSAPMGVPAGFGEPARPASDWVWQERATLAATPGGGTAVLGSWVIGGEAAGLGIREADGPVTDDASRFVPHYIDAPRG
jgi:glutathionylspermidine synthase